MSKDPDRAPAGVEHHACDGHDPDTGEACAKAACYGFGPPETFCPPRNMMLWACPDHRAMIDERWRAKWQAG